MELQLIQAFVEIIEAGNLSEAARRRAVTRSHVSRQLAQLERQAGAQLLRRTTRRLEPTEQGLALYEHGLRIQRELDAARATIDSLGRTLRGHLRVSVPTGLGEAFLIPLLLEFGRRNPGITLRVLFSNRVNDLIAAEIDVAVKITSQPPLDTVARELCRIDWQLYAAPAYLAAYGEVAEPQALAGCRFICTPSGTRRFELKLERDEGHASVELVPQVQSEHFPFLLRAAQQGAGIALLPAYMAWEDVQAGRLVPVLPQWRAEGLGNRLFVLTTQNLRAPLAVRALIEYLAQEVARIEALPHADASSKGPSGPLASRHRFD
jgi:DNA-binding transcriptional LysR family regulator